MCNDFDMNSLRIRSLLALVMKDPYNAKLLCVLARQYMNEEMYVIAIETLIISLKIDNTNYQTYCDLGKAYFRMDDKENGHTAFIRVIEINPTCTYALQNLASYYIRENDYSNAKKMCEKLIIKDKLQPFLFHDLFRLALECNDYDFLQSFFNLDIPYILQKSEWIQFCKMIKLGQYDELELRIGQYLFSEELSESKCIEILCTISKMQIYKGEFKKAQEILLWSLRMYHNSLFLFNCIVQCAILSSNYECAIVELECAVARKRHRYDAAFWLLLLKLYKAKGDTENIEAAYAKIDRICFYKIEHKCVNAKYYEKIYDELKLSERVYNEKGLSV